MRCCAGADPTPNHPKAESLHTESGAFWNPPLVVPLVWLVESSSVWSEAHHWLCWFWVHFGGVQVQVDVRSYVYLALDYLSGAIRLSTVCDCIY